VSLEITDDFSLTGIALGTILVIAYYHLINRGSRGGTETGAREVPGDYPADRGPGDGQHPQGPGHRGT
jgi:hypothetical protein